MEKMVIFLREIVSRFRKMLSVGLTALVGILFLLAGLDLIQLSPNLYTYIGVVLLALSGVLYLFS